MPFALQAILLYRSNQESFQSSMSLIVGVKQLDNDKQNFDQKSKIWEKIFLQKFNFFNRKKQTGKRFFYAILVYGKNTKMRSWRSARNTYRIRPFNALED